VKQIQPVITFIRKQQTGFNQLIQKENITQSHNYKIVGWLSLLYIYLRKKNKTPLFP